MAMCVIASSMEFISQMVMMRKLRMENDMGNNKMAGMGWLGRMSSDCQFIAWENEETAQETAW
jgi:hypothetical protein